MAAKKAHYKVQTLKEWTNHELQRSDDQATDDFKKGLCTVLEKVLRDCNYDISYTYNYWDEKGYIEWQQAGSPTGNDQKKTYLLGPTGQEYNRHYH